MSRAALTAVPDLPDEIVDPRIEILSSIIDQHWRSDEWDPARLTLRIDPNGPLAHGRGCRVSGCTKTTASHHGLCSVCRRHFTKSGEPDLELWLSSAVRTTPLRGEQSFRDLMCAVEFGGHRCGRPALTRTVGLCGPHDRGLRGALRQGRSREDWLTAARPLPPNPRCRAQSCDDQQETKGMCKLHYSRWQRAGKPEDIDEWLVGQHHPVTNGLELWLGGLPPLVFQEFLYVLQTRDKHLFKLNLIPPRIASRAVRERAAGSLLDLDPSDFTGETPQWLRHAQDLLSVLYRDESEERARDVWDLRVLGLHAGREKATRPLLVDFSTIRQPWLRAMAKDWILTGSINRSDNVRNYISSVTRLSDAVALGAGHADPTKLGRDDISRFVKSLKASDLSSSHKRKFLSHARQFLAHARRDDWLVGVPGNFEFLPTDVIERDGENEADDDLVGKALPKHIIAQLDTHTKLLSATVHRLPLGKNLTTELRLLAYRLLRDTGRRVSDIAALSIDPVVRKGDEYTLVYDNIKARRQGRRLPIEKGTADAIAHAGEMVAAAFPDTPRDELPLFPRPTRNPHGTKRIGPEGVSNWIDAWFDRLPPLHDDRTDESGALLHFPRERLYCHAFRHAYAQRLADAGTHPDVTRELMDHKSLDTTMTYYTVTAKRRREAVDKVAALRVDRNGNHVGPVSSINYGRQAVAVPYGNCREPSNVAAGGKACPIRFQCAGCSHYRPDPSFLPAIETHIAELMTNREEALAAGSADWVIDGFEAELAAYRAIIQKMKNDLAALDPSQRAAIEEASVVLRKARAADAAALDVDMGPGNAALPTVVHLQLLPIGERPDTAQGDA